MEIIIFTASLIALVLSIVNLILVLLLIDYLNKISIRIRKIRKN